jgi:uncharacterized protein
MASCWVVTPDKVGMVSQALGLAEALGFADAEQKIIDLRWPWTWAINHPWFASLDALSPASTRLEPPWPDLLIACGRQAALMAIAVRRASGGRTRTIYVQHPRGAAHCYDLIIAPEHDRLSGPNVITSQGALHRAVPAKLAAGAAAVAAAVGHLPRPRVAVLIGGSNDYYRLTPEWIRDFALNLRKMSQDSGCGLMITSSRRTGAAQEAALREVMAGAAAVVWTGQGANPYFGYLGLANAVIVTCDSVSMITEACATGKPVLVARLPGGSRRFERFFEPLLASGHIRWFAGRLEQWPNRPLVDMGAIAAEVRHRLALPASAAKAAE